ncbi:hypothetical protein ACPA9J_08500 [Pseudomonas aeruginosa]
MAELSPLPDESANRFFARLREAAGSLGPAARAPYELPFAGGLGYLSYDLGRRIERTWRTRPDDLGLPLASVGLYAWALISDHQAGTSQLVSSNAIGRARTPAPDRPGLARKRKARPATSSFWENRRSITHPTIGRRSAASRTTSRQATATR